MEECKRSMRHGQGLCEVGKACEGDGGASGRGVEARKIERSLVHSPQGLSWFRLPSLHCFGSRRLGPRKSLNEYM